MKEITAYQCSDGAIFNDDRNAKTHEDDLLGQEIDGLLKLYKLDISRNQEYKGCLSVMQNRAELRKSVSLILAILEHGED